MSDDLIWQFPCSFPIKVMGKSDLEFDLLVIEIIRRHVPDLQESAVKARPSKNSNFISVTVTVQADSKEQLDAIYRDLTAHPKVLMTL